MILPDLHFEAALWQKNISLIAGLDEAGRGAWCGPVAAAAVILPPDESLLNTLKGVRDSKLMSAKQRETWADVIRRTAVAWRVGMADHEEIDRLGIVPATRLAMQRAIQGLHPQPRHLLIDAVRLPAVPIPQQSMIKGDQRSLSIAAASILAKTARDALLVELADTWPQYGFERHKGYGTRLHQRKLAEYGPCPLHRQSFAPIKALLHPEQIPEELPLS